MNIVILRVLSILRKRKEKLARMTVCVSYLNVQWIVKVKLNERNKKRKRRGNENRAYRDRPLLLWLGKRNFALHYTWGYFTVGLGEKLKEKFWH